MKANKEYVKKIIDDPHFLDFLNREFRLTANHATLEELAEFAFGSIEEAIKVYVKKQIKINRKVLVVYKQPRFWYNKFTMKKKNMIIPQVKNDLTTVLDYLLRDEEKHYFESKYRKNHIFLVLKRLAKIVAYES